MHHSFRYRQNDLLVWHRALPKVGGLCNIADITSFNAEAQQMVVIKLAPSVFDWIGWV